MLFRKAIGDLTPTLPSIVDFPGQRNETYLRFRCCVCLGEGVVDTFFQWRRVPVCAPKTKQRKKSFVLPLRPLVVLVYLISTITITTTVVVQSTDGGSGAQQVKTRVTVVTMCAVFVAMLRNVVRKLFGGRCRSRAHACVPRGNIIKLICDPNEQRRLCNFIIIII